jgi:copper(I)-binding protein
MSGIRPRAMAARRLLAITLGMASVLAGSRAPIAAQEPAVVARDGWVRLPAPSKDETVLYVVLENHSAEKRAVVGASSDAVGKIEMHEMRMVGRLMSMSQVERIVVPGKGKTELRSGGLHMMLFGFKTRPSVGDSLKITLTLDDGTTVPVTATVRK